MNEPPRDVPSVFWIPHAVRPDQQHFLLYKNLRKDSSGWMAATYWLGCFSFMMSFLPYPPNAFSYLYMFDSIYSLSLNWSKAVSRMKRWGELYNAYERRALKGNGRCKGVVSFLLGLFTSLFLLLSSWLFWYKPNCIKDKWFQFVERPAS